MLTRRQFALTAAAQVAPRRPNVLFVFCGQWRRQAMPGEDAALQAPQLARLAKEGVTFPRAYVANPASGPSRAALQTGRYPHAVSMPWSGRLMPLEYPCLADAFAEARYETGYIGNWHLDAGEPSGFTPPGPRRRGYQYWAAANEGHDYFHFTYYRDDPRPVVMDGYEPDHQTDLALEFLRKKRSSPFLLFLSFGPPHGPARLPERHAKRYSAEGMTPRENVPAAKAAEARKPLAGYYGLCSSVDENIGRLLAGLAETGQAENTLVIFTSDHGEMLGSQGLYGKEVWYEESVGVPLVMRWPGRLEGGTQQDFVFNNVDMAPTLRGLCGLAPLDGAHGEDRSELLLHNGMGKRPESLYVQGELGTPREWRMVIRGWDKLVVDRELKVTHLYNLAQDPFEKDNLVIDRATIRRQEELLALMRRWINKSGDRVPYPGKMPA